MLSNSQPAVVTGVFSIVGFVVGGGMSFIGTWLTDRTRYQRRLRDKKRERLAEEYAHLIRAGRTIHEATQEGSLVAIGLILTAEEILRWKEIRDNYDIAIVRLMLEPEAQKIIALADEIYTLFDRYRNLHLSRNNVVTGDDRIQHADWFKETREAVDKKYGELRQLVMVQLSELENTI